MDIKETLKSRGKTYGGFASLATTAQRLKNIMANGRMTELADDQFEALDMISTKLARILNGDPDHIDTWDDIAGYATLVADRLRKEKT